MSKPKSESLALKEKSVLSTSLKKFGLGPLRGQARLTARRREKEKEKKNQK